MGVRQVKILGWAGVILLVLMTTTLIVLVVKTGATCIAIRSVVVCSADK
jgi:hypothetical protein